MGIVPGRHSITFHYRTLLTSLEKYLFLPDINPSWYNALAIAFSIFYLYTRSSWLKVIVILLINWVDWLDGATARRYNRESREGYIIDIMTDRVGEAFIFAAEADTATGQFFFLLWLINMAFTFYSVYSNKHTSLPLRYVYLVVLIAQM